MIYEDYVIYLGWCLLSNFSINLSEGMVAWARELFCFEQLPTSLVLCADDTLLPTWSSLEDVFKFSSSPKAKRCNISSLDIVLCTCCLSTTLAERLSLVTCFSDEIRGCPWPNEHIRNHIKTCTLNYWSGQGHAFFPL